MTDPERTVWDLLIEVPKKYQQVKYFTYLEARAICEVSECYSCVARYARNHRPCCAFGLDIRWPGCPDLDREIDLFRLRYQLEARERGYPRWYPALWPGGGA